MASAIVGIGRTAYTRASGRSTLAMAAEACRAALADCGLGAHDVDGIATYGIADSSDPLSVGRALGIEEVQWDFNGFTGGRIVSTLVATAGAAVEAGLCDVALVYRSLNGRSEYRLGDPFSDGSIRVQRHSGAQLTYEFAKPHGFTVSAQWAAMYARRHQVIFGSTSDDLGRIAVTQRSHAHDNEHAIARDPLDMETYLASRWIYEPLRLYDCCYEVDGAIAVVITKDSLVSASQRPVWLVGSASSHGTAGWDGFADLSDMFARTAGPRLWDRTGFRPSDIDVACMYDAFTPIVMMTVEGFGFCEKGQVADFYAAGGATYGGDVVINPHGGLLSEGYIHGMNHVFETVMQLRGEAGTRQVAAAEIGLVTSGFGPFGGAALFSASRPSQGGRL